MVHHVQRPCTEDGRDFNSSSRTPTITTKFYSRTIDEFSKLNESRHHTPFNTSLLAHSGSAWDLSMPRSLMMPVTLQTLPIEIICQIFTNLGMLDLLTCSVVTKHLRRVVMGSSQLQYTIELGRHRMVSLLPASAGPSFSTRLNLLRDREMAWKYMNWKKRDTLRLPPTGSVYEFVGGLYGNGREDDSRVTASISFLELPSADTSFLGKPDQELQTWTHVMGDVTIVDFTMDPSQDLLVLVALAPAESRYIYELHLRSIKTNQPHPKAPVSTLSCLRKPTVHLQSSDIVAAVRVQVAGNLVALLIKEAVEGSSAHLEIWNWENSPQFSCAMGRPDGIDDFTFLSHDSFLLVLPPGQFEVYSFADPIDSSTTPILRVTYAFPPLSDGYLYWYISMSSNPAPGYVPRPPTDQDSPPGKSRQLYYPHPDERIHACCLYIFNPSSEENHHVHSFVFFLNLQTLLNPPAKWFAKPASPRHTRLPTPFSLTRRSPANMGSTHSDVSSTPAPPASSSINPLSTDVLMHGPVNSTPTPGSSSSQLGNNANTLPPYPLFPTFDSLTPSSGGQASNAEPSVPNMVSPTPEGPAVHLATRRCGPRSLPTSSQPVATVPWEVWGPQSTRWFEECLSTDWQHAVYGLRTVESVDPAKRSSPPPTIDAILDQNFPQQAPVAALSNGNGPNHTSVSIQTQANGNGVAATGSSSSPSAVNGGNYQTQTNGVACSSTPSSSSSSQLTNLGNQPTGNGDGNPDEPQGDDNEGTRAPRQLLRIRDFNPYSFASATEPPQDIDLVSESVKGDGKGKHKARWRVPRLVLGPSVTPVKGVFKKDIVSSLPYMEVVSEEAFEVTDVMMDDCRLLLLKRGDSGRLKRVDVLMM